MQRHLGSVQVMPCAQLRIRDAIYSLLVKDYVVRQPQQPVTFLYSIWLI